MPGPPTAADGDKFFFLGAGQYSLVDTELKMEFAARSESLICPFKYYRQHGRVNPNGSITIISKAALFAPTVERTYVPMKRPGMTRQPDW